MTVAACTPEAGEIVAIGPKFHQILKKFRAKILNQFATKAVIIDRERNGKEVPQMAGLMVFKSLADALRAGYQVYDRTADGYLVRTRTSAGWAIALVSCR